MKGSRQDLHPVRLAPCGDCLRSARPSLVEPALDPVLAELQSRRTAVDHAADRPPVALAPRRHGQEPAEAVDAHPMSAPNARMVFTKPGKLVAIISAPSTWT